MPRCPQEVSSRCWRRSPVFISTLSSVPYLSKSRSISLGGGIILKVAAENGPEMRHHSMAYLGPSINLYEVQSEHKTSLFT